MPTVPHVERHFTASDTVRDIVIGMSDGLTVPFALAAGLSGAVAASGVVITAGLAEIAAGSIAMGLGGYLAARSDAEHYASEYRREAQEVRDVPEVEGREIVTILQQYGVTPEESAPVVAALRRTPKAWIDFMMRFELGLDEPDPRRALVSAATIAGSYAAGGMIPLSPYFAIASTARALVASTAITLAALAAFGWIKGVFTDTPRLRSATQTLVVGGIAACAAFLLAKAIS